jgi:hypothetical protein
MFRQVLLFFHPFTGTAIGKSSFRLPQDKSFCAHPATPTPQGSIMLRADADSVSMAFLGDFAPRVAGLRRRRDRLRCLAPLPDV